MLKKKFQLFKKNFIILLFLNKISGLKKHLFLDFLLKIQQITEIYKMVGMVYIKSLILNLKYGIT